MEQLHFTSIIKLRGINPYVVVSAVQAETLKPGWRKPLPVLVRVNNQSEKPWRTNLMPSGTKSFYLYLHGGMRKASRSKVGDTVTIDLSFDADYHNGPLSETPSWFYEALEKSMKAKRYWESLIPSRKKEIIRYFSQLHSPEAKARNLERVLRVLSGEKCRFMGRDWN
jgi:hypothetical protein